jgi:hypothetical protein
MVPPQAPIKTENSGSLILMTTEDSVKATHEALPPRDDYTCVGTWYKPRKEPRALEGKDYIYKQDGRYYFVMHPVTLTETHHPGDRVLGVLTFVGVSGTLELDEAYLRWAKTRCYHFKRNTPRNSKRCPCTAWHTKDKTCLCCQWHPK